jgi:heptosyltransferase III
VAVKRTYESVLVVCTRRIGDVLLATPVIRSLKAAVPHAAVDMLVFSGTEDVVAANPDIRRVWTVPTRASVRESLTLLSKIWRRYDLALSVLPGDRPVFYAWAAGRRSMATVTPERKSWWKRLLLDGQVSFDNFDTHTVVMNLQLLKLLGVDAIATPVVTWAAEDEVVARAVFPGMGGSGRYAVLHVTPKFVYKAWTESGWALLGRWIRDCGLKVVVVGGTSADERGTVARILEGLPSDVINLTGRVTLRALGSILSRAALYVGTDTAVTHMAAALGVPTVALFGPSNPVKWGPWPSAWPADSPSPWKKAGSQRQGNVYVLQGEGDCVPCFHEGCGRHVSSTSDCLQQLPVRRVIEVVEQMLQRQHGHPAIVDA